MIKSVSVKCKQNRQSNNNKKKSKKTIVIDSNIEEDCENSNYKEDNKENELVLKLKELEYREKDLALKNKRQLNLAD
ncbi:hypothetical protein RhiirA4_481930 [Rhizophagus irregularis]|uniref:Uncharacterized protein n=1 Tax=Rhizophagus irregularis TaxID=588596 RepID=A0A2I1HK94_9GLOM|nr:hypothetical protein RhiirA4_481930 [Rhizophagus irregularis]